MYVETDFYTHMHMICIIAVDTVFFFQGEFTDDGTETHFLIGSHEAYIKAVSSGKRREGIIHNLIMDEVEIPPAMD